MKMGRLRRTLDNARLTLAAHVAPLARPANETVHFRLEEPSKLDVASLLKCAAADVRHFDPSQLKLPPSAIHQVLVPAILPARVTRNHCFASAAPTFGVALSFPSRIISKWVDRWSVEMSEPAVQLLGPVTQLIDTALSADQIDLTTWFEQLSASPRSSRSSPLYADHRPPVRTGTLPTRCSKRSSLARREKTNAVTD